MLEVTGFIIRENMEDKHPHFKTECVEYDIVLESTEFKLNH